MNGNLNGRGQRCNAGKSLEGRSPVTTKKTSASESVAHPIPAGSLFVPQNCCGARKEFMRRRPSRDSLTAGQRA